MAAKTHRNRKLISREQIINVLASPEFKTREEQAKELGLVRRSLQERLAADTAIFNEVLEIKRKTSADGMAAGYSRLGRIIKQGRDDSAISAIRLLAQLRGELVDRTESKIDATVHRDEPKYTPAEELLIAEAYLRRVKAKSGEDK